jgi:hypothetical protein
MKRWCCQPSCIDKPDQQQCKTVVRTGQYLNENALAADSMRGQQWGAMQQACVQECSRRQQQYNQLMLISRTATL